MAQFPILRLTHAGQEMAGMSQGGGKLTFVRVELGDGQLKEEDSIEALTGLKRSAMQLPLQGYLNEGNGKARLRFVIDNSALTVGFHNREVGIFAKIDNGAERLYAYTNAGNYADWIPSKETPIDGDIVDLHIVIGNAANVTIQTVSGAYATKIELEEHRTAAELDHPEKSVHKKHLSFEVHDKAETDILVNSKVNKSGDTMSGALNVPKIDTQAGYFGDYKRDTGDAIADNGGANVNIGSWYGLGFYSTYSKRYTGTMDLREGNWRTVGAMTARTFYSNDWFRATGNSGFYFEDHGGGWQMTDDTWIRSYGNKNIYTAGKMKADAGFEGTATNANKLQNWSLQNILDEFLHVWHANKAYTVGDIAYHKALPSWARLECVIAGTTGNNASAFSKNVKAGQYIIDGGVRWIVDDVRDCNRVGTVTGSLYLPDGYIKANGATVQRADYPRLVALADKHNLWTNDTANNLGMFGRGNGSSTFVLPNWIDRMAQFAAQGGNTLAAGLPNITGGIENNPFRTESFGGGYGALVDSVGDRATGFGAGANEPTTKIRFDASKSNPIYGRSHTVQPAAIQLIPIIKY